MGGTATGKTDAAAALFDRVDAEIISVDSSLVYQGMDIGTAKPDQEFLKQYPHHLVNICEPNQTFSVADFYTRTMPLVERSIERGKLPILVGGTNFYFNSIEKGLAVLPKANPELRQALISEAKQIGWPKLHARLADLDIKSAQRIDVNDAQRIQRALEIVIDSGKTVAEHNAVQKPPTPYPILKIALAYSDRDYLHQRIEQRFTKMLEQGFAREVEQLLNDGVQPEATSMKMIGYRQMVAYFRGNINRQEMVAQGVAATRQLAKRQFTWLRNQSNIIWWVDFGLKDRKYKALTNFITEYIT